MSLSESWWLNKARIWTKRGHFGKAEDLNRCADSNILLFMYEISEYLLETICSQTTPLSFKLSSIKSCHISPVSPSKPHLSLTSKTPKIHHFQAILNPFPHTTFPSPINLSQTYSSLLTKWYIIKQMLFPIKHLHTSLNKFKLLPGILLFQLWPSAPSLINIFYQF